ncbi:alpha/beta-hydrolase [Mycena capillaripes]|nr:alpha/beta-hydrolase [Mycena capillaripes]
MAEFPKELVKIPSVVDGKFLDVWLFKPSGPGPFPLMTVIKDAGLAAFGQRWPVDAHYASLIFDYRCFGGSDGEPRNFVSLVEQREDYETIIRWARLRPELFLSTKIVLMGSTMSGLVVMQLALDDPGLAGVMAHSPTLDGYDTVMAAGFQPRLLSWAAVDKVKGMLGLPPLFMPAVGHPNEFALLNTASAHPGFTQGNTPFSDAPNLINLRIVFEFMSARPGRHLKDDILPIRIAIEVARESKDTVTLVEVPGGHFDFGFDVNIRAQCEFLRDLSS